METQQIIRQSILARGYIGSDRRFYSKYSLNDMAWAVMGIHPIHNSQVIERIQQEMRLDDTTVQYGGPLSIEQVEQVAERFAQSGFSLRTVTRDCVDCGKPFEQFPHPSNEQAFYYACPDCREKRNEAVMGSKKGWGDASGIYRGIKH